MENIILVAKQTNSEFINIFFKIYHFFLIICDNYLLESDRLNYKLSIIQQITHIFIIKDLKCSFRLSP